MKDWNLVHYNGNRFLVHYHRDQWILDPYVGQRNWYFTFPRGKDDEWKCTYCEELVPEEMVFVALLANVHDGWI